MLLKLIWLGFMIFSFSSIFTSSDNSSAIYSAQKKRQIIDSFLNLAVALKIKPHEFITITSEEVSAKAWSASQLTTVNLFCAYLRHIVVLEQLAILRDIAKNNSDVKFNCLRDSAVSERFVLSGLAKGLRDQRNMRSGRNK